MKIKTDFITNSSSSSFIVAIRDAGNKKGVLALLQKELENYGYLEEMMDSLDIDNTPELAREVLDYLFSNNSLKLEGWTVSALDVSSDGGAIEQFIYSGLGGTDEEDIKIK